MNKLGSLPLGGVIFRTILQLEGKGVEKIYTVEPRFNKPLPVYNEVLSITNDFLYPSNSKIYGKEPRCNESSLQRTHVASLLALRYIEVPLQLTIRWSARVLPLGQADGICRINLGLGNCPPTPPLT